MKTKLWKNPLILVIALLCLLPFCIMVFQSFQKLGAGGFSFTLEQYGRALFQTKEFFIGFWNSLIYTVVIIGINVPVSLMAAYGFSQFRFRGRDTLFWLYIVLMLMPFQATIVPQYLTLKALGILDSAAAIILPNAFSTFGTFLMCQYMKGMDRALFDAGRIDGLSEWKLFLRLVLPISRSAVYALVILSFVNYWSMVEQPSVFITNQALLPLSVQLNHSSSTWSSMAYACGTVFSILPLLLYIYCFDDLLKGISLAGNSQAGSLDKGAKDEGRVKRVMRRCVLAFLIAMVALTLVTQKITHLMTTEVSICTASGGELSNTFVTEAQARQGKLHLTLDGMVGEPRAGERVELMDPAGNIPVIVETVEWDQGQGVYQVTLRPIEPSSVQEGARYQATGRVSLGQFDSVVPLSCVYPAGTDYFVYIITDSKTSARDQQALQIRVSVRAQSQTHAAISGNIAVDAKIVRYASRPLMDGNVVRVIEEVGGLD